MIRKMTIDDYDNVYKLWTTIEGFAIRSLDDSREGIKRFLERNPNTSVVYEEEHEIIGAILCGHDGRQGCFYHVCVHNGHRNRGIGHEMVGAAVNALKEEGINKVNLVAFTQNEVGNTFWNELGWKFRSDLNNYDYTIREDQITVI
ncbi:Ribosomal protein S18 acetylase RimI [Anaerosporobacter mobilis DSM 15930]|jgi:ribosomal protein S18 acetylase RimI-like enzyme|uniref:Ribosomal protein S18 acetylase RimI n=1 Tax=Anaerosporobacter mobilis DSM 15930 TaxID=1120996 RepID=A0A1M7KFQ4_9FIRM|nr:GNAT family N-acetyltransferase [Anaerosporobacter mobilis]SHM63903.1 Ribosomal protein S18 acetylase RimI [Anaerosporobacter mobilis DSM 15930]